MVEPTDITVTILREMREEMRESFRSLDGRMDRIDARMDALETRMDSLEAGLHGVQIVLVTAIGTFDQRIRTLEAKA
jgi:N12 class adenine-specific DNA methylase